MPKRKPKKKVARVSMSRKEVEELVGDLAAISRQMKDPEHTVKTIYNCEMLMAEIRENWLGFAREDAEYPEEVVWLGVANGGYGPISSVGKPKVTEKEKPDSPFPDTWGRFLQTARSDSGR